MDIPSTSHQAWKDVLTGKRQYNFESFAVQLVTKRLSLQVSLNPSPDNLNNCVKEFREMFVKNARLPRVQKDLEKIFGKGGIS